MVGYLGIKIWAMKYGPRRVADENQLEILIQENALRKAVRKRKHDV